MSYSLDVISQLSEFKGRAFKKHNIEGVETIGVWGNEPFEVVFTNHAYYPVQVKLSIDGTDLLTGKPADTNVTGDMWMVKAYGKLTLKAWPESNKGGAQLIFTSAEKSVAVNTHGNLNSRGVIAAAVFTESYVAPYTSYGYSFVSGSFGGGPFGSASPGVYSDTLNLDMERSLDEIDDVDYEPAPGPAGATNYGTLYGNVIGENAIRSEDKSSARLGSSNTSHKARRARETKKELKSLAAVGAGEHIVQKLETVEGFIKPALAQTLQVKYLWWDDLVEEVKAQNKNVTSGFPGDEVKIMSIGSTPRIRKQKKEVRLQNVELSRF